MGKTIGPPHRYDVAVDPNGCGMRIGGEMDSASHALHQRLRDSTVSYAREKLGDAAISQSSPSARAARLTSGSSGTPHPYAAAS